MITKNDFLSRKSFFSVSRQILVIFYVFIRKETVTEVKSNRGASYVKVILGHKVTREILKGVQQLKL